LKRKNDSILANRSVQWAACIQAFSEGDLFQMLFGYGSNYYVILGRYSMVEMSAHNVFFGQLVQNGLCGLLCMVMLYALGVNSIITIMRNGENRLIAGLAIALMLSYQMISIITWEFSLTFLLLGLAYNGIITKEGAKCLE
jgi:O-antigen ligase